jgi:endonuclease/exonuclease/phosphatase family metal-dependent hydrolase
VKRKYLSIPFGNWIRHSSSRPQPNTLLNYPSTYEKSMKILMGDFNAKVGRENIFKPIIGNESLHGASNDNGVRVVNFATSTNLTVKSKTFPHCDIHKHTWTYPDGVTHNQTDHVLTDKRRHSNTLDIRSFRGAGCDTDHCLVVAKLRERISVCKRARQNFD